jgi:hypothetical protein
MLHREIISICSQIHTKRIYTLRGQNVELLNVTMAVLKHVCTMCYNQKFSWAALKGEHGGA